MSTIHKHLDLMGRTVKDCVTEVVGVVESVSFDLYGCIQACVRPPGTTKDGELNKAYWFDVSRLKVQKVARVMELPDFAVGPVAEGRQGPASKTVRDPSRRD